MELGALNSIVEVGIALNVAFGGFRQFRDRLGVHLQKRAASLGTRIESQLQSVLGRLDVHHADISIHTDIVEAKRLKSAFDDFTGAHQAKAAWLAVAATVVLLGLLPYFAICATESCGWGMLVGTYALALGPLVLWGTALLVHFRLVRRALLIIDERHRRDVEGFDRLAKLTIPPKKASVKSEPPPPRKN